jgi:nucleotide-binding universal stress UspA family protein
LAGCDVRSTRTTPISAARDLRCQKGMAIETGEAKRPVVVCAVDLGPATRRVLYHAAGLARVLGGDLKIVHVAPDDSPEAHRRVLSQCLIEAPYQEIDESDVVVRTGRVSEMIQREALRHGAALIVMGSRGCGGLSRMVLGSSGAALMRTARTPVLFVPYTDIDIVSIGDTAALTCGSVLAAVDLDEACAHQLRMAARMAALAHGPLMLMTVARARVSEHDAVQRLRERAHALAIQPHGLIVRRGDVAIQISQCASSECAGLVVMGLRERPHGRAGAIASAVLEAGRAFVLAVPGCQ